MKVIPPSKRTLAIADALHNAPIKPITVEAARAQVIEHLAEARAEILRGIPSSPVFLIPR